jgi:hypothetical protein
MLMKMLNEKRLLRDGVDEVCSIDRLVYNTSSVITPLFPSVLAHDLLSQLSLSRKLIVILVSAADDRSRMLYLVRNAE